MTGAMPSPPDNGAFPDQPQADAWRGGVGAILAVVVTFNPADDLPAHLAALSHQVGELVVIDNGSARAAEIERDALRLGCRFMGNAANLGVAAALNQAAKVAIAEGFAWLATFDQDSLLPAGALAALLDLGAAHPQRDRIAVLAMSHRDRATGRDYHRGVDIVEETPDWRSVRITITSGNIIRTTVFDSVGFFDEALFIDSVDHDFCLRCRHRGLLVVEACRLVMEHSIGAASLTRVLGRRIALTNHSARRRYYITRNSLEIIRRNLFKDFAWSLYNTYYLFVKSIVILLYEPNRAANARAMMQGSVDFFRRRFGPM